MGQALKHLIEHILYFQELAGDKAISSVGSSSNTARFGLSLVQILIYKDQEGIIVVAFHLGEPG